MIPRPTSIPNLFLCPADQDGRHGGDGLCEPPRSDHFNWLAKEKPNCLKGSVYPKIGEKDEDGGTNRKIAI